MERAKQSRSTQFLSYRSLATSWTVDGCLQHILRTSAVVMEAQLASWVQEARKNRGSLFTFFLLASNPQQQRRGHGGNEKKAEDEGGEDTSGRQVGLFWNRAFWCPLTQYGPFLKPVRRQSCQYQSWMAKTSLFRASLSTSLFHEISNFQEKIN